MGTPSITYPNVAAAGYQPTLYVQGLKVGTTDANGLGAGICRWHGDRDGWPVGLHVRRLQQQWSFDDFRSLRRNGDYGLSDSIECIREPTSRTMFMLSPGFGSVIVPITSSDTTIGTITTSPVVFNPGDNGKSHQRSSQVQPGTTTIAARRRSFRLRYACAVHTVCGNGNGCNLSMSSVITGVNLEGYDQRLRARCAARRAIGDGNQQRSDHRDGFDERDRRGYAPR